MRFILTRHPEKFAGQRGRRLYRGRIDLDIPACLATGLPMLRDSKAFFDSIRLTLFHRTLDQGQAGGITAILSAWNKAFPRADIRFVAYSLATTYHETAYTIQPIEEIGKGRGRAYGVPAGPWRQVYFGRGDVQETWYANYLHANARLHALGVLKDDENLAEMPDLACRPDVAAAIMIYGMTAGWFTGKRLADYFNARISDSVNARRIINGTDCAAQISIYYGHFLDALKAGGWPLTPQSPAPISLDLSTTESVQAALCALGYQVTLDGANGLETERAVRAFQAAHADTLVVDGDAGPLTRAAIRNALSGGSDASA